MLGSELYKLIGVSCDLAFNTRSTLALMIVPMFLFMFLFLGLILGIPRFIGWRGIQVLNLTALGFAWVIVTYVLYVVGFHDVFAVYKFGEWFSLNEAVVDLEFLFDSVSLIFWFIILSVSIIVHLFAILYMAGDPHRIFFFCVLTVFTIFMLILISANNAVVMFIGWEGVGICSYLLIGFWTTRQDALRAALQAVIMNRVGDLSMLVAFALMYKCTGTWSYDVMFDLLRFYESTVVVNSIFGLTIVDYIAMCLLLGISTKSAQFGFHPWLVDAMEGPTPVSALLHSATMVTAGVFISIRYSSIFEASEITQLMLFVLCFLTILLTACAGLSQDDGKKMVAYSTSSQLSYMLLASSMGLYNYAFFHLFNHSFTKSLVFILTGLIIHSIDEQDLEAGGAGVMFQPVLYVYNFIATLAIGGSPFFSIYYSKDFIFEHLAGFPDVFTCSIYAFFLVTSLIGWSYSLAPFVASFLSEPTDSFVTYNSDSDELVDISFFVVLPLLGASMVSGSLLLEYFTTPSTPMFLHISGMNQTPMQGLTDTECFLDSDLDDVVWPTRFIYFYFFICLYWIHIVISYLFTYLGIDEIAWELLGLPVDSSGELADDGFWFDDFYTFLVSKWYKMVNVVFYFEKSFIEYLVVLTPVKLIFQLSRIFAFFFIKATANDDMIAIIFFSLMFFLIISLFI